VFQWQLSGVFSCASDAILTSPQFKVGNGVWKVNLWPQGFGERNEGFMSMYLYLVEGPAVSAKFNFVIKSQQGDVSCLGSGTDVSLFTKQQSWGYGKFAHRKFVTDQREAFYEDCVLDLEIEVEIQQPHRSNSQFDHGSQRPRPVVQEMPPSLEQECVICLANHATSGLVHGFTCHKCLCEECAMQYIESPNQECPVCRDKVDQVILKFY